MILSLMTCYQATLEYSNIFTILNIDVCDLFHYFRLRKKFFFEAKYKTYLFSIQILFGNSFTQQNRHECASSSADQLLTLSIDLIYCSNTILLVSISTKDFSKNWLHFGVGAS